MSYSTLINLETLLIAAAGTWLALVALRRLLTRTRPNLDITRPINVGYVLRLGAIAGVSASGLGQQLRGGDEATYLAQAHQMVASPWFSAAWTPEFSQRGSDNLHVIMFAIQMKALHFGPGALRVTQVGIALAGAILVVAAVYDLAGPRAARLTAWFAALEPASVFFSGTLLKEFLEELAAGLVIFGAARMWRRFDLPGLLVMGSGCLVAVFDRGYVGFFLPPGPCSSSCTWRHETCADGLRRSHCCWG